VAPQRALLDPITCLTATVREIAGDHVNAVILFGSLARGQAYPESDIDLAVIAPAGWDGRIDLEDAVRTRLGNDCDVLVFTRSELTELARTAEPVVTQILTEGIPLIGSMPPLTPGAA
jgi:predicted nucleotidyltransferase